MTRNRRKMIEQMGDSLLLSKHSIQLSALFLLLSGCTYPNRVSSFKKKIPWPQALLYVHSFWILIPTFFPNKLFTKMRAKVRVKIAVKNVACVYPRTTNLVVLDLSTWHEIPNVHPLWFLKDKVVKCCTYVLYVLWRIKKSLELSAGVF